MTLPATIPEAPAQAHRAGYRCPASDLAYCAGGGMEDAAVDASGSVLCSVHRVPLVRYGAVATGGAR